MMLRLARPYAVIGWAAAVVGAVGGVALRIVDPVPVIPDALGFGEAALVGFVFLGLTFASVGALLVLRRPENAVGWCLVLIGAGNALAVLSGAVTSSVVAHEPASVATAGVAAWLTNLFTMLGALVLGLGFIFPTGRGQTPAWDRFVRIGAVMLVLALTVLVLFRPGPLQVFATIQNPFGFGPDVRSIFGPDISTLIVASPVLLLPVLVLSIVSRYRMSDRVGRQQLKWFILALFLAVAGFAAAGIGALIGDEPPPAGLVMFGFAGAFVPVAIGIAILRHNLYDIDRLISRSIAYAVVSAIMALVYGGVIVLVSTALASFTQGPTVAVAASTLTAFAVFQPVLHRVRGAVDRRFNRARYDAERTVTEFSDRLRHEVDLTALCRDLDATIRDAISPRSLGLWLRESKR